MKQNRKKFGKEFKKKAVELSCTRSNSSESTEELGIDKGLIYRWQKEFNKYRENSFPGHGSPK